MRNIYYRFGFGAFTNQDELYFVDFVNFSRHNLPVGGMMKSVVCFRCLTDVGTTPPAVMYADISRMRLRSLSCGI